MKLDVEPDDYAETYSLFTMEGEPHPAETLPLTRAVLKDETVIGARWLIRRPDGTEVLALGNAQPVYSDGGQKIGAVLTIRDDTARHATEVALAEAVKVKEALLYEVNHRVKNSLQIVTSLLMLQSQSSDSQELKQSLKEACARVDIVAGLHNRLYSEGRHSSVMLGS
jgi:PAS domain-containing protein